MLLQDSLGEGVVYVGAAGTVFWVAKLDPRGTPRGTVGQCVGWSPPWLCPVQCGEPEVALPSFSPV